MTLKFGAFIPPFHSLGEDPTTAFWRDLDLIHWLDELGLDEAWVGEHHSGGWSTVSSPRSSSPPRPSAPAASSSAPAW